MGNANFLPVKRMRLSSDDDHTAITQASKTDFMTLNPDCLLKLFEYLHLDDLSEMAEVNLMLKSLATYYFHLKYRHFNCVSLIKDELVPIEHVKKLLNNFGDQIVSLHMSHNIFVKTKHISTNLLSWAEQYCKGNVKTLILEDFKLKRKAMQDLTSLFQRIEAMNLIDCGFQAFLWASAENLKCLKLKSTTLSWRKLYMANLKQLEDAEFTNLNSEDSTMIRFISSVPMLKRLSIIDCEVTTAIFWTIGKLEDLVEFEFQLNQLNDNEDDFQNDLLHLKKLKQLKVVRLDCEKRSVQHLLDGFVECLIEIEHLELAHGQIDDATIDNISKLTTIKTLKLNGMIGLMESHIFRMTKGLQLLEELCIKTRTKISGFGVKKIVQRSSELSSIKIDSPGFTLNTSTYQAMVAIVQKCIKQTSLSITIYSNGGQLLVSEDILQAAENAKWVAARELDRDNNHIFPHYNTDTDPDDEGDTDDDGDFDDVDDEDDEEDESEDEENEIAEVDEVVDGDEDDEESSMWVDIESDEEESGNDGGDTSGSESSESSDTDSSDSDSSESSDSSDTDSSDSESSDEDSSSNEE